MNDYLRLETNSRTRGQTDKPTLSLSRAIASVRVYLNIYSLFFPYVYTILSIKTLIFFPHLFFEFFFLFWVKSIDTAAAVHQEWCWLDFNRLKTLDSRLRTEDAKRNDVLCPSRHVLFNCCSSLAFIWQIEFPDGHGHGHGHGLGLGKSSNKIKCVVWPLARNGN